jgi:hypothetical protein
MLVLNDWKFYDSQKGTKETTFQIENLALDWALDWQTNPKLQST